MFVLKCVLTIFQSSCVKCWGGTGSRPKPFRWRHIAGRSQGLRPHFFWWRHRSGCPQGLRSFPVWWRHGGGRKVTWRADGRSNSNRHRERDALPAADRWRALDLHLQIQLQLCVRIIWNWFRCQRCVRDWQFCDDLGETIHLKNITYYCNFKLRTESVSIQDFIIFVIFKWTALTIKVLVKKKKFRNIFNHRFWRDEYLSKWY